mmetsp:Transcript_30442/g.93015  ORF Transcript_30442/g.93015 Transcript_30442/m.93015 type:complete len:85 (-) Transcript_30442:57-311(-)
MGGSSKTAATAPIGDTTLIGRRPLRFDVEVFSTLMATYACTLRHQVEGSAVGPFDDHKRDGVWLYHHMRAHVTKIVIESEASVA